LEWFPRLHCSLLEPDCIVSSKFMRGFDDEQVLEVSQLTLDTGNDVGTAAGDTEALVCIDVSRNKVRKLRMSLA